MLLLSVGHVVSLPRVIDALWPQCPPSSARDQVHNGVSALRRRLVRAGAPSTVITTSFTGISLARELVRLDLHRAQTVMATARAERDHGRAARGLRAALKLWSGPSLAGLAGPYFESIAAALEEQRLVALEQCLEHELEVLAPQRLVAELTVLVAEHPLRESFVRLLMLALYRASRQADALAACRSLRLRLHDELGIEPSRAVAEVELAILR
jgi:DNA-binding SARP family transcriptional activator